MNKQNKIIKSKSVEFDAERVINTPDGKELISTEMAHKKNVEAASFDLKEISTDESVQMIHKIDDYFIKLDRDEARIKYERDLLNKKRREFEEIRNAKYGRLKTNLSDDVIEKLGDFTEGFSYRKLLRPVGIVAATLALIWLANIGFNDQEAMVNASIDTGTAAVEVIDDSTSSVEVQADLKA
jgi:hypothetical protein